ncbi:translesion DNA synthesis-associated protein ImuA [Burkholderia metallica]|uniref:translesion DNA synthesis-associated protein ImuA n=1 Tax=Burkholderia metallica TaxID=488729 RepID=UPI001576D40C|nr:translesion DNA synthesis-associated protein ImuA [Burkholderia metallica]NTZ10336.1 translesion DNA synthesis-associated protein ImuA [Burkholderia metallica]
MYSATGGITLWRGSQLARGGPRTIETGFAPLSAELPGGGWPVGGLVELLAAQPGCGEMRLLAPALARSVSVRRPLALVAPPQSPHATALASLGVPTDTLLWLRAGSRTDALWAAEQALKTGCCGALLLWQDARPDALRRLHLAAARTGDTLFVMLRPLSAARQPSPAVLRVALYPVPGGVSLDIVKRRGPARSEPLVLDLPSPIVESRYARLARHPSAAPAARRVRPAAV